MSLLNHCRFFTCIGKSSIIAASLDHNNHSTNLVEVSRLYCHYIQRCIENKSLTGSKAVHARILQLGLLGHSVGNKLTDGYLKCGCFLDARKLFDELPHRTVITWNSMISYYVTQKKFADAVLLYPKMVFEGVLPDRFTFLSLFKAFSQLGLMKEGKKAHGVSVILGLEVSDEFVSSAIVDMYAKLGLMQYSRSVFDRVLAKDLILFTSLIVGYTQHGHCLEALESFKTMINEGIQANEYTFASVLISSGNLENSGLGKSVHCLILKSGIEKFAASQTSLLTMYSRCGFVDDSLKIFEDFADPNLVTWTSLITGLIQNGQEETALVKFKEMVRRGLTLPNSFTLSSVVRACSRLATLESGKQIHSMAVKFGLERDMFAGASLVDFYGKCGSSEMARRVFDDLVKLDLASFNSMIYSYALNGYGLEAIELYNRMEISGLEPNDVTVLSILLACNNSGLVEEGFGIFDLIRKNRSFVLTNDHYACMVNLLGRCGRLEEAESLVKEVKSPDIVLWRTLVGVCRIHGAVEIAERALFELSNLDSNDGATHVLMSNIYASSGNWGKVIEVKSKIREMKLKKEPAVSWVEIENVVHTFMAGDWSHPSSEEIKETLEYLADRVRNLGYVPDTKYVLQNFEEDEKKISLNNHSEKVAIAFALFRTKDRTSPIRIFKNLRVCGDCHSWIKFVSEVVRREFIVRDAKRFHQFKDGSCSCGDYW